MCALIVWRSSLEQRDKEARTVWLIFAGLLFILAGLKFFRAAPFLVGVIREWASRSDWYEHHQIAQVIALISLGVLTVAIAVRVRPRIGKGRTQLRWMVSLSALLVVWVSLRASSFHIADQLMGTTLGPLTISQLGEAGCLISMLLFVLWSFKDRFRTSSAELQSDKHPRADH